MEEPGWLKGNKYIRERRGILIPSVLRKQILQGGFEVSNRKWLNIYELLKEGDGEAQLMK